MPRHASRGDEIARMFAPDVSQITLARRSKRESITLDTDIYLADTMGELGLFYRLASVAFIGGTLVPHGGQNPLEAARLGCGVVAGPHMENFAAVAADMQKESAIIRVQDPHELTAVLARLFSHGGERAQLAAAGQMHVRSHGGALAAIAQKLQPYVSGDKP